MPGPTAVVHPRSSPLVCQRHRRWLGAPSEATQYDLPAASDVLVAYRSCVRFLADSNDTGWPATRFRAAWQVTRWWACQAPDQVPALSRRWRNRAKALGISPTSPVPAVVTFPETVALARVLDSLDWRRHGAIVDVLDIDVFYQQLARRLGESPYPRSISHGPLLRKQTGQRYGELASERDKLAEIRNRTWEQAILHPQSFFPDIRQFRQQAADISLGRGRNG
jgi:hypothetical protein